MEATQVNSTFMPGCYVEHGVIIEANVHIGPNAVVLGSDNDADKKTILRAGVQIGANATIYPGITIGLKAKIMPGSVVARSVPPLAIVQGNPAEIIGYVESSENQLGNLVSHKSFKTETKKSQVKGVSLHRFSLVPDLRGNLSVGEFEREIPFKPSRYFLVFDVPTAETRGEHAHRQCKQFLIAVKGSVSVVADDGQAREEFLLDKPNIGLYLPPMTWGIQYRYSPDTVLLVFASDYYDSNDYIRNYDEFIELANHEN